MQIPPNIKLIQHNNFKIILDTDYLQKQVAELHSYYDAVLADKDIKPEKHIKVKNDINILANIAIDIIKQNRVDIFNSIPLTSKKQFHKTKTYLLQCR